MLSQLHILVENVSIFRRNIRKFYLIISPCYVLLICLHFVKEFFFFQIYFLACRTTFQVHIQALDLTGNLYASSAFHLVRAEVGLYFRERSLSKTRWQHNREAREKMYEILDLFLFFPLVSPKREIRYFIQMYAVLNLSFSLWICK